MKKILFLCLTALFVSCSAEEGWQEMGAEESTLAEEFKNIANGYELMIKGYTLEELQEEKDETPKSDKVETVAEPWMIKAIQESLPQSTISFGSKTRADAQPYGGSMNKVGVFKNTSCGNNREFIYFMDCEDGGGTFATKGIDGRPNVGATIVDSNVTFKFCLVDPGNYGGGTLLLYNYVWNIKEGDVDVVKRYHDNEDTNNRNKIQDNGGLTSTGLTSISANTTFYWRFSDRKDRIPAGLVLRATPHRVPEQLPPSITIDDENKKNGNEAILTQYRVNQDGYTGYQSTRRLGNETFRGITVNHNTVYSFQ